MLERPDEGVLAALARMGQSAEWGQIEEWLKRSREGCVKQSLNTDSVTSRQAQGGFMLIDELISTAQKAHELSRRQ